MDEAINELKSQLADLIKRIVELELVRDRLKKHPGLSREEISFVGDKQMRKIINYSSDNANHQFHYYILFPSQLFYVQ